MIRLHRSLRFLRAHLSVAIAILLVPCLRGVAQSASSPWSAIGPYGGDARSLAGVPGQPGHLYLGTTNSMIYESTDDAATWQRIAKLDSMDDLVIDHILVDPQDPSRIYAPAWKFDHPDGGLWISRDAGHSWEEAAGLHGQSIRAFAQAPSDPRILFAGTLKGVYRSEDAGATWKIISPPGSSEIHEVESLAVDPKNPNVVYAGTWHLPWKTSDGGEHWENIKQGVIDDSDVFSIVIDPKHTNTVYMSACSGIYKSDNYGGKFRKIEGIPATARRTRVLRQDPAHLDTVYAGTTEGLYETADGGRKFQRVTDPEVIVNDVLIDSGDPERVLLATDRGGVLSGTVSLERFESSNSGFSARKVEALLVDTRDSDRVYAGVVNDKSFGGVFVSDNTGTRWKQVSDGLDGRDVFALAQSAEGIVLAGTNNGIFEMDEARARWSPANSIANRVVIPVASVVHGKRVTMEKEVDAPLHEMSGRVFALDLSGDVWAVASSGGLFTSKDKGATWQGGLVLGADDYRSIAVHGSEMAAARENRVVVSHDAGRAWSAIGIPTAVTMIHRVAYSHDGTLWLGSREGVYFTRDQGKTWLWIHRLPLVDVNDLFYDPRQNSVLVSSRASDFIYIIDVESLDWKWRQTGFHLLMARPAGNRLLAASINDGVLVEPQSADFQTGQR